MRAYRFTLAEDDPNTLFLLHFMLSRLYPGSSIASFSRAEDALIHIVDTGTDILVTDHGMGTMSGTELVRELRQRDFTFPIIMISGDSAAAAEAFQAGATEFLDKSSDTRILEQRIRNLVPPR